MSKYDYITKNAELATRLSDDLEKVIDKYGLTLVELVEDRFEGHIVAHFKLMGDTENETDN